MEGASNGGILYHEVQEGKLCALHCVNAVLQGPFFSELDLAALATDLDHKERQVMQQLGDFVSFESHNVSLGGDFSIQVLQKALEVWDLQAIPLNSPVAESAQINPDLENAFICHLHDHWFCIRKVNGEWYNFDSFYVAPQHLSKFYLAAYLDSLSSSGWSIFLVRGNFPKEFPITSSEASNGYGQWLSPEDAESITKSCNSMNALNQGGSTQQDAVAYREVLSEIEDRDLRAAIAASKEDTLLLEAASESSDPSKASGSTQQDSLEVLSKIEDCDLKAAIAASKEDFFLPEASAESNAPSKACHSVIALQEAGSTQHDSVEVLPEIEYQDLKPAIAASKEGSFLSEAAAESNTSSKACNSVTPLNEGGFTEQDSVVYQQVVSELDQNLKSEIAASKDGSSLPEAAVEANTPSKDEVKWSTN
ncbi:hypothetical protein K2173_019632 [Erythroxylum novogranatense]|uniref:ubiquitinyl hydrolase 1 n=1 Tax=Erythroxylum novogranatense TaxID=1862640 RepID=A0AAV8UF52_9ROSI|nr:hypothetical protein K2173_019632 [Erythroxylum novogranatense]